MKISRTVRTTRIVLALIAIVLACVTIATASFASTARNVRAHENTAKAKTPTIGLVYTETDQNAWQEIAFGAQRAASQAHVKYYSSAPSHLDGPAEVNLFQTMTRRAKDGIALQTLTPALFLRSLNDAAR